MTQTASTAPARSPEEWSCPDWCLTSASHTADFESGYRHPADGVFHQSGIWKFATSEGESSVQLVQAGDDRPELFIDAMLMSVPQADTLAHLLLAAVAASSA